MRFNLEKAKSIGLIPPKKEWAEYDQDELQAGIEIEKEHTNDPDVAASIAANHLDEIPDYYTRLKKMEAEAKPKAEPSKIAESITEDIHTNNGLVLEATPAEEYATDLLKSIKELQEKFNNAAIMMGRYARRGGKVKEILPKVNKSYVPLIVAVRNRAIEIFRRQK